MSTARRMDECSFSQRFSSSFSSIDEVDARIALDASRRDMLNTERMYRLQRRLKTLMMMSPICFKQQDTGVYRFAY